MRVRRKDGQTQMDYEVVEESPSYYIVKDGWIVPQSEKLLPKSNYEPIPTETWRDVTKECTVEGGVITHNGKIMRWANGYRPKKVSVCREGGFADCSRCDMWAFIVEKRHVE